jgi:ABC-type uncharacterized transport system ATPase subunit
MARNRNGARRPAARHVAGRADSRHGARRDKQDVELATHFAIVVIEHDMAFVHAMACRTLVMHRGKVIADGAFTDIEHDPLVRDVYLGRR